MEKFRPNLFSEEKKDISIYKIDPKLFLREDMREK